MIINCPGCKQRVDTMDQTEFDQIAGVCWICSSVGVEA